MGLAVKAGVQLEGVQSMMGIAALIYELARTYLAYGDGTITGGTEPADDNGAPRPDVDPHPLGMALDLRTNDLDGDQADMLFAVVKAVDAAIGGFFTWVEESDHLHVQLRTWRSYVT